MLQCEIFTQQAASKYWYLTGCSVPELAAAQGNTRLLLYVYGYLWLYPGLVLEKLPSVLEDC